MQIEKRVEEKEKKRKEDVELRAEDDEDGG